MADFYNFYVAHLCENSIVLALESSCLARGRVAADHGLKLRIWELLTPFSPLYNLLSSFKRIQESRKHYYESFCICLFSSRHNK